MICKNVDLTIENEYLCVLLSFFTMLLSISKRADKLLMNYCPGYDVERCEMT